MKSDDRLSRYVHTFFHDYLTSQRNVSPQTLLSYRDTLKLFLQFGSVYLARPVVELVIDELDVELVLAFLNHLEQERKNSAATRNVRLAALHTFFKHVAARDPLLLNHCHRIVAIPLKRTETPAVEYLEPEELEVILRDIDRSTPVGRRDYALLSLTYQTGARAQEILGLRACDLQLIPPAWVRLWGKGRKERVIPLWETTAELLRALLAERNIAPESTEPVFVNMRGRPLTRWGFNHILKKRCRLATASLPALANKRIHPHVLRHTTAVHMLQADADPNTIRDVLGHASSETTWRYARIMMDRKRKAIEACSSSGGDLKEQPVPIWHRDGDLLAQLESLGRQANYGKSSQPQTKQRNNLGH